MKRFSGRSIKSIAVVTILAASMLFSSCLASVSWLTNEKKALIQGRDYLTESEMRIIALEYKSRFEHYYRDLLTESFWEIEVVSGYTYEDYVKDYYILEEAEALLYLNAIAKERNVVLTDVRKEAVRNKAEAYMKSLSDDEKTFLNGVTAEDAEQLLLYYESAFEMIRVLSEGKKLEVSDEESRVVDIQVIRVEDRTSAEMLHERIVNGENFATVARAASLDARIDYSVSREDLSPEIAKIVFMLNDAEETDVIEYGGSFYLIRLVSSVNVLLSSNNRKNLLAARRYENWADEYDRYLKDHPETLSTDFWRSLKLNDNGAYTSRDDLLRPIDDSL